MFKYINSQLIENPKRRALILVSVLSVLFLIFVLFSDFGIIKRIEIDSRKAKLESQLLEVKSINDSLKSEANKLKTDTLAIERIAREKYGMIKQKEEVINLVEDDDE